MILYFTSHLPTLIDNGDIVARCELGDCRLQGFGSHLCFSTKPISGMGNWVYSIDVPTAEVAQYQWDNDFRDTGEQYFALPYALVRAANPQRDGFEAITGRPWNSWIVPVLDRRTIQRGTNSLGKWALVWMSHHGAATAKVHRKSPDNTFLSLTVTTTKEFAPTKDYIVIEQHEESEQDFGERVKETWQLSTLAGCTPQWAVFPSAWRRWVWNEQVLQSAVAYIVAHVPQVRTEIEYALEKSSKANTARAWRMVAAEVGRELSRKLGDHIDLGKLAGHSWTAVAAMPHRIALRMSQHLPYEPWTPPLPKPEYENPDTSGRVLLASLYGVFPTHGPGVDHSPQERVYNRLQGELWNRDE